VSTFRFDASATFDLTPSLDGVPSDAPVDSTLHRRLASLDPDTGLLPSLSLAGEHALVEGELLGEGGMGRVHEAHDSVLERTVALKRVRPEAGPRARGSLVAEARILAALDHPNIVPVHSLGRGPDGAPILVMKKVAGEAWSALLRRGRDLDRELRIFLAVCDALRFAHSRGLLHRDLKPDNVMVGSFGEVYLMDWGCSCPAQGARTEEIVGTPQFMAPEMVRTGSPLGPETDVFLLGATLHMALTGRPRNSGRGLREVLLDAWEAGPFEYGAEVPAELAQVLNRACARDPADRFPSVQAFAEGVMDVREHRAAQALAATAASNLPALEAAVQGSEARADALFAECRFGFRAALQIWPDCPEAKEGQARVLEVYLPWKLTMGELSAVESLLPELDPAVLPEWERRLREARAVQERRESGRQAFDLHVAARERRSVGIASLALIAAMMLGVAFAKPPEQIGTRDLFGLGLLTVAAVVLGIVPFRQRVLATRASKALMLGAVMMTLTSLSSRAAGMLVGLPPHSVLVSDCLIYGLGFLMLSLTTERWLALSAIPLVLVIPALLTWPAQAPGIYPVAGLMALGLSLLAFTRRAREVTRGGERAASTSR